MTGAGVPLAGRREWVALAVIALPCLLYSMDLSVLYLALPSLTADLKPGSAGLLWITDIYGFMIAGFLIAMGTLGDRIGRRRLMLVGAAAFGVASVLAAFAASTAMLIVARAVMGIAAATLAPSTLSLIRNMFLDPRQRTVAIGVWVTSFSAGAALGPLLGGVLLHFSWWGSVFLIAVPVMALLLVLGPVPLPEFRNPHAGRFDFLSATLSLASVLAMVYGVKELAQNGFGRGPVVTLATDLIVGAVPPERAGVASGLSEPAPNSAARWASPCSAVSPRPSTAAGSPAHCQQACGPGRSRPRGTLAAAVHAADRLPPHLGRPLLAAARGAFTQGLHVAAIVAAALAITLAVATATMLRRPQPPADTETNSHRRDELGNSPSPRRPDRTEGTRMACIQGHSPGSWHVISDSPR